MVIVITSSILLAWKWDLACGKRNKVMLQRAEAGMVGWTCGVKVELREKLGLDDIISVLQQNRV